MTPEQQRIAIAEACGWVQSQYGKWSNNGLILPDPLNPPDYLNDLNAMHEAEKVLPIWVDGSHVGTRYHYQQLLANRVNPTWATAAQRAEVFLRTVGKWKEERK